MLASRVRRLPVGVIGEVSPVDERKRIDIGREVARRLAAPVAGWRGLHYRVDPHRAGQLVAGAVVGEEFSDVGFAFA